VNLMCIKKALIP